MADLSESSRLFEASSRLDSAATVLLKLSEGQPPTGIDRQTLEWAGSFLREVDWSTRDNCPTGIASNLAVQATEVRPTFYAALIGIQLRLREAGLNQEKEVANFLRRLYQFLINGGPQGKTKAGLPADKLKLASAFLRHLAEGLLIQLTDNGLPRQNELLIGGLI
jgi:hypothetical protein